MKMSVARKQEKQSQPVKKVRTRVADGFAKLPVLDASKAIQHASNNTFSLHCDHVVTTWELITPRKAEQMLNVNNINRKIRDGVAEGYAADMAAGQWTHCVAPIVIYDNGNIADGQHRLWAIVDSNTSQKFMVCRGLRQPEGLNIDTGAARTVVDAARISGVDPSMGYNLHSAARGIETGAAAHMRTTHSQKLAVVAKHRKAAQFAISHVYGKKLANSAVYAAVGRAWYTETDKAKLGRFCEVLCKGQSNGLHESAAVTLRNYLLTAEANLASSGLFRDTMLKSMRAIKRFMQGKQLLALQKVTDEEYPL